MHKGKIEIMNHYKKSIDWVNKLREITDEKWRTPIEKGIWTAAEIIGHLVPWDEFVLKHRIPHLFTNAQLPVSPDAELVNQKAAKLSRVQSRKETIDLFIENRNNLIKKLSDLQDDLWIQDLFINGNRMSLYLYLKGLIEHDIHHFKQIQIMMDENIDW